LSPAFTTATEAQATITAPTPAISICLIMCASPVPRSCLSERFRNRPDRPRIIRESADGVESERDR
jgi:hypothetical protein